MRVIPQLLALDGGDGFMLVNPSVLRAGGLYVYKEKVDIIFFTRAMK